MSHTEYFVLLLCLYSYAVRVSYDTYIPQHRSLGVFAFRQGEELLRFHISAHTTASIVYIKSGKIQITSTAVLLLKKSNLNRWWKIWPPRSSHHRRLETVQPPQLGGSLLRYLYFLTQLMILVLVRIRQQFSLQSLEIGNRGLEFLVRRFTSQIYTILSMKNRTRLSCCSQPLLTASTAVILRHLYSLVRLLPLHMYDI